MEARCYFSKEWVVCSEFGQEKTILNELSAMMASAGPLADRIDDMRTVVAEACLNAFEHGNRMIRELPVRVRMTVNESRCSFRITDEGDGFHAAAAAVPPNEQGARGWGLLFMQALADEWTCGYREGRFYVEMEFIHSG